MRDKNLRRGGAIVGRPAVDKLDEALVPEAADLEALKAVVEENETINKDAEMMEMIDSQDKAKAFIVSNLMSEKAGKLKHISELSPEMISNLMIVGTTNAYLEKYGVKSVVRQNLYTEILALMVSHKRQGRKEIIDAMRSSVDDLKGVIGQMRSKYNFLQ
jgi:hypothetical protein